MSVHLRELIGLILNEIDFRSRMPLKQSRPKGVDVLKKFPTTLKNLGVDPSGVDNMRVLGAGTRGFALDAGGDTVLKVTDDAAEARAAAAVVAAGGGGGPLVNYRGVVELGDTGLFLISQEKLAPLSREDASRMDEALRAAPIQEWIKRAKTWKDVESSLKEYIAKHPESVPNLKQAWTTVTEFGIPRLFETLTKMGIKFHDYHAGNFMRRGDELVLIDLGNSTVAGGEVKRVSESTQHANVLREVIRGFLLEIDDTVGCDGSGTIDTGFYVRTCAGCPNCKVKGTAPQADDDPYVDPYEDATYITYDEVRRKFPRAWKLWVKDNPRYDPSDPDYDIGSFGLTADGRLFAEPPIPSEPWLWIPKEEVWIHDHGDDF